MPENRFVRRWNRIPDQSSLVSTREQARLLNDPGFPVGNMEAVTNPEDAESEIEDTGDPEANRSREHFNPFLDNEKAAGDRNSRGQDGPADW
jgi:hypothetical protein